METALKATKMGRQILRNLSSSYQGNTATALCVQLTRHLSLTSNISSKYPKYYIKPVYRDQELQPLKESGELAKLAFVPVRAAESDQNASVWHDPLVSKFTNMVMRMGNKVLARSLVDKAFENMKRTQLEKYYAAKDDAERSRIILNPWEIFHKAVQNCRPLLETMPIKRGGTVYQVPIPVRENKSTFMGMKWIIEAAKVKDDNTRFHVQLAKELIDASNDTGRVIKKKQDLHKLCEANRAYAHFRWS